MTANWSRRAGLFISIFVTLLLVSAAANAQSISISIESDPAGVAINDSGSPATSFDVGTVSRNGGALPIGLSSSMTPTAWILSTPIDVMVTKDPSLTSASYTLQGMLAVADGARTWQIDSVALNAAANSTITVSGSYDALVQHTWSLRIPDNSPSEVFSNTITLTAVSN